MDINKADTAVLVTDPQNDFLSEKGATWQLVALLCSARMPSKARQTWG